MPAPPPLVDWGEEACDRHHDWVEGGVAIGRLHYGCTHQLIVSGGGTEECGVPNLDGLLLLVVLPVPTVRPLSAIIGPKFERAELSC